VSGIPPLVSSQRKFRTAKVDIDIDVDYYFELFRDIEEKLIQYCSEILGVEVEMVNTTVSKSGRIHLHVVFRDSVDIETFFRFKYCIGDDRKRLQLQLFRASSLGDPVDFFY